MGCNGGWLWAAWGFLKNSGICSDECLPYVSGNGNVPECPSTCEDGSAKTKYKAKKTFSYGGDDEGRKKIMKEIEKNGPMETGFTVYADFMSYSSGIYVHETGEVMGGHAVKMIGYGYDEESQLLGRAATL